jgi:hypothetical protein
MTEIEVVENPGISGKRKALVLTEDRVGHYPEFRDFFVRRFALDANGLSRSGYVRAPSGMTGEFNWSAQHSSLLSRMECGHETATSHLLLGSPTV